MNKKIYTCLAVLIFANAMSSTPPPQVANAQNSVPAEFKAFSLNSSGIGAPSLEKFLAKACALKKLFERDASGNFVDNSKEACLGRWVCEMSLRYGWF